MKTTLPWTIVCERRHEQVVAIEKEAKALDVGGSLITRRGARKAINGRGRLLAALVVAREEAKG